MSTRIIMEPLRVLLAKQFDEAGAKWDLKQQVKMVKALKAGLGSNPFASRDYRVAIAASGAHDRAFYTAISQMLEHPDLWKFFPQSSNKVSFRAQLWRTIARMGCSYRIKAKAPHDRFPTQVFRLLHGARLRGGVQIDARVFAGPIHKGASQAVPDWPGARFADGLIHGRLHPLEGHRSHRKICMHTFGGA